MKKKWSELFLNPRSVITLVDLRWDNLFFSRKRNQIRVKIYHVIWNWLRFQMIARFFGWKYFESRIIVRSKAIVHFWIINIRIVWKAIFPGDEWILCFCLIGVWKVWACILFAIGWYWSSRAGSWANLKIDRKEN